MGPSSGRLLATFASLPQVPPAGLRNKASEQLASADIVVFNPRPPTGPPSPSESSPSAAQKQGAALLRGLPHLGALGSLSPLFKAGLAPGPSLSEEGVLGGGETPEGLLRRLAPALGAGGPGRARLFPCVAALSPGDLFGAEGVAEAAGIPGGVGGLGGGGDDREGFLGFALQSHDKRVGSACLVAAVPLHPSRLVPFLASLQVGALSGVFEGFRCEVHCSAPWPQLSPPYQALASFPPPLP